MSKKQKAIFYIILSAFCFSLMNLFVKLSGDLPSIQKSFFRNLVSLFVAGFLLLKSKEKIQIHKENLGLLILRSTFGTLGILFNFYAISKLNLADASILNKLSPFFVILFSYIFLKEKITPTQGICVLLAFVGSLFIIKPSFQFEAMLPALLGFSGGLCAGAAYTVVRALSLRGEKSAFIVCFFSCFSCLAVLPYLLFHFVPMSSSQVLFLLLAGVAASGAQFAITAAYANAPASEISIYDYSIVIFAALWSFLFWKEVPDLLSVIGYGIIFTASFFVFLYNRRLTFEKNA